jgi:hypothetical protein
MMRLHILVGSVLVLAAGVATAGVLAPKKPSETIVLTNSAFSGPCTVEQVATQVATDGEEVPFALAPGETLMITDISWVLDEGTPGDTVGFEFYAGASDIAVLTVDGEVNARGVARGRERLQTPVQMNDVLCANPVVIEGTTIPTVHELRVIGFVTKDR